MNMLPDNPNAREIAEHLLEKSRIGFETGDFELFSGCYSLPHTIETFEGTRVVETIEESRVIFEEMVGLYTKIGMTRLDRNCIEAEFKDEATVAATYETRMLAGDQLLERPYPVFVMILKQAEGWQIANHVMAIKDIPSMWAAISSEVRRTG